VSIYFAAYVQPTNQPTDLSFSWSVHFVKFVVARVEAVAELRAEAKAKPVVGAGRVEHVTDLVEVVLVSHLR
jgi:hypothetical protein